MSDELADFGIDASIISRGAELEPISPLGSNLYPGRSSHGGVAEGNRYLSSTSLITNNATENLFSIELRRPASDVQDMDLQAVEMLRNIIAEDGENENLQLEPHRIIGTEKFFTSDSFDLLADDTLALPFAGCWKKHNRAMGWGIKSLDGRTFIGFKRTFVFHSKNNKTNLIMNVYAMVNEFGIINTTKYLCHVFQCIKYDPRPLRRSPIDTDVDPAHVPFQFDQADAIAFQTDIYQTFMAQLISTGDEYYDLNAAGSSTGIASGKKRKIRDNPWIASVKKRKIRDNFTEVSASIGPAWKVLTLCICNVCGMAYRKTSGTGTLANHNCKNR